MARKIIFLLIVLISVSNSAFGVLKIPVRDFPPEELEFYRYINSNFFTEDNSIESDEILKSLVAIKGGGEEVDMLIAKCVGSSDGFYGEIMPELMDEVLRVRPNFISNIYKSRYYTSVVLNLYCFLYFHRGMDIEENNMDFSTFEKVVKDYINSLPQIVSDEEKEILQVSFIDTYNNRKNNVF